MRLLLDTCTFIWLAAEPDRLSNRAGGAVSDESNELFLSHASAWEIHIKSLAKKLVLPGRRKCCSHPVIGWLDAPPGIFGLRSIQVAAI
jgi:PIN domain nuclease of toxin-antitoxin system